MSGGVAELLRAELVKRLAELSAKASEIGDEIEGLKAELRAMGPGEFEVGDLTLKITQPRSFNAQTAIALVPEELRQQCLSVVIDPAKVKANLTPVQVETCMEPTNGKAKVTLS